MSRLEWPDDGCHLFVGGDWLELDHGDPIPCISPIDETTVGHVAAANAHDVDVAIERIRPALQDWSAKSAAERGEYLRAFAALIREHSEQIAALDTLDGGMLAKVALDSIFRVAEDLEFHAGLASEIKGSTYPTESSRLVFTIREPFGIVVRIVPFNMPFRFAVKGAAPALIAGNVVILKPSEHTSLSALALGALAKEVFPPGVLNVVTGFGREAGAALVEHPAVGRIACTGSAATGRAILEAAAKQIKLVTLELGGKNPLIVAKDSDPERAATVAFQAMSFSMAGQACQSSTRLLIHNSVYDDVVGRLADKMQTLVLGDPREPGTGIGPVAFRAHYERVRGFITSGIDEGAKLVTGGSTPAHLDKGFYVQPTLFGEVTPEMRIYREEIFGPVVDAIRWDDADDVIKLSNDTEYGLYGRIVANSVGEALALAKRVDAGTVLVNTAGPTPQGYPFGGYKESGLGKQNCLEEVLSYTQEKGVVVEL